MKTNWLIYPEILSLTEMESLCVCVCTWTCVHYICLASMVGMEQLNSKSKKFPECLQSFAQTRVWNSSGRSSLIKQAPQTKPSQRSSLLQTSPCHTEFMSSQRTATNRGTTFCCLCWVVWRRRCWGRKADGIQNRDVQTGLEHGVSLASRRKMGGWVPGVERRRPGQARAPWAPFRKGYAGREALQGDREMLHSF